MHSLFILLLFVNVQLLAQIDSLRILQQEALSEGNLCDYYTLQSDIEDELKYLNVNLLYEEEKKYNFLPHSKEDSSCFRYALMLHGHMLKKHLGNVSASLEFYLKSHQLLRDKDILDSNAWYTENEISHLYARLNDYDKAEYFANKVESYLIGEGNNNLLSRLYSSMGDIQRWKRNDSLSIVYYTKGLKLAKEVNNKRYFL